MPRQHKRAKRRLRERLKPGVELSNQPDFLLLDVIHLPRDFRASPWKLLAQRLMWAAGLLVFVTILVYVDQGATTSST